MNRKVLRIDLFSQVIYYGGYSGEDPPLPIPNREVKLTIADGTDLPVGRVGSRRFWKPDRQMTTGLLCFHFVQTSKTAAKPLFNPRASRCPQGRPGEDPRTPSRHECFVRRTSVYRSGRWCDGGIRLSASASGRKRSCPQG